MRFAVEDWWAGDRESYTTGQPSKFNIDALEDSELMMWKKEDFEKLLNTIPGLKKFSDDLLAKSHNTSVNRVHMAISLSSEERYEDFIGRYPDIASRVPLHMIACSKRDQGRFRCPDSHGQDRRRGGNSDRRIIPGISRFQFCDRYRAFRGRRDGAGLIFFGSILNFFLNAL